jgi:putative phosphoribosyl transferase
MATLRNEEELRRTAERDTEIRLADAALAARLSVPAEPLAAVAFAHGSGSSRLSTRNRLVASTLNEAGIATLLFDLLTPGEALDRRNVFDIELLARRLTGAAGWIAGRPDVGGLPLGLFGASTGAAAALVAAAELGGGVGAVVSRGGRPDLAAGSLPEVASPTLLVVGGADPVVLELNRSVVPLFAGEVELEVVPGASHLFEEPGALVRVAALAREWFLRHLGGERKEER